MARKIKLTLELSEDVNNTFEALKAAGWRWSPRERM